MNREQIQAEIEKCEARIAKLRELLNLMFELGLDGEKTAITVQKAVSPALVAKHRPTPPNRQKGLNVACGELTRDAVRRAIAQLPVTVDLFSNRDVFDLHVGRGGNLKMHNISVGLYSLTFAGELQQVQKGAGRRLALFRRVKDGAPNGETFPVAGSNGGDSDGAETPDDQERGAGGDGGAVGGISGEPDHSPAESAG
jgi:hypothetical protein